MRATAMLVMVLGVMAATTAQQLPGPENGQSGGLTGGQLATGAQNSLCRVQHHLDNCQSSIPTAAHRAHRCR